MLSRHNIRVKVLQSLYAYHQAEHRNEQTARNFYLRMVEDAYRAYLLCMMYLQRIAEYNLKDYEIRNHKYVPTEEDKNASLALYHNPVVEALRSNDRYLNRSNRHYIATLIDHDVVRKLFLEFSKTPYYETYSKTASAPISEHQYALVNLYKFLEKNELFNNCMDDLFPLWEQDQSLVYAAVKRSIRALPQENLFFEHNLPNEEFVHDFGRNLLSRCLLYDEELQELINPRLENWKEDRIALVDTVLIKMALAEFMYFETIPTKVTLDEYVNLSKDYSTDKSRRFVNGILDRLLKDLTEANRISKEGRGLE